MTVGEKIKSLRMELGLTQTQLSELTKIPRTSISTWEIDRSLPSADALFVLADALQCTVSYLIGKEISEDGIEIKYNGYIPTDEEVEFLKSYKKLSSSQKQTVKSIIANFLEK